MAQLTTKNMQPTGIATAPPPALRLGMLIPCRGSGAVSAASSGAAGLASGAGHLWLQ